MRRPFATILRRSEPAGYSFSSLIEGIVESVPFRMRRSAPAAAPAVAGAP